MKLFVAEAGSPEIVHLAESSSLGEVSVSALAAVEVRSAIRRRERAGDITQTHAVSAIASLAAELRRVIEHQVTEAVLTRAETIIDRHTLRTLDALQLATALLANEQLPGDESMEFVCSDSRLLEAASLEGLAAWNPETM